MKRSQHSLLQLVPKTSSTSSGFGFFLRAGNMPSPLCFRLATLAYKATLPMLCLDGLGLFLDAFRRSSEQGRFQLGGETIRREGESKGELLRVARCTLRVIAWQIGALVVLHRALMCRRSLARLNWRGSSDCVVSKFFMAKLSSNPVRLFERTTCCSGAPTMCHPRNRQRSVCSSSGV